MRTNCEDH
jgi:hypothetical protein